MREESDFEISGWLKARRLRATHTPKATTIEEGVLLDRRRGAATSTKSFGPTGPTRKSSSRENSMAHRP
jgi:hypothetical protein